ncbi:MAG: hypothetical protein KC474_05305 [Cyanobacteria bacterium HKST-UBA04]|nr:hypothetical protein [Cyanobacteria bacterium HKST-UBA04]
MSYGMMAPLSLCQGYRFAAEPNQSEGQGQSSPAQPPIVLRLPNEIATVITKPPKARLADHSEIRANYVKGYGQALSTVADVFGDRSRVHDHQLATLDDKVKTLAVALIAGLGSLGLRQSKATTLPMWLGAVGWLGAMAITPRIINGLVRLKTGVRLDRQFLDSNGDIKPFYLDPNYLPLQIIDRQRRQALYKKFRIPQNDPNRALVLKDKLKQLSVQARTWWMLMAGFATPVLAAGICDMLEPPFKQAVGELHYVRAYKHLLKPALSAHDPVRFEKALSAIIDKRMGQGSELTHLATWWKAMPETMLKTLGIDKLPLAKLAEASEQQQFDMMVDHLTKHLGQAHYRHRFETALRKERRVMHDIFAPLVHWLKYGGKQGLLTAESMAVKAHQVQLAKGTAQATLDHLQHLLSITDPAVGGVNRSRVAQHMEKNVVAYMEQLVRDGKLGRARELIMQPRRFDTILSKLGQRRFDDAFKLMGESPRSLLGKAIKSHVKRQQWLHRYPAFFGGLMGLTSLIYIFGFLGRDIGKELAVAAVKDHKGGQP